MKPISKKTLNNLVEEHITAAVRDSIIMQRHCKRSRITPLHSSSVKLALTCLQRTTPSITNTPITKNSKQKVDLNALLADEISLPTPTEIGMTLHWLAVDGTPTTAPIIPLHDAHKTLTDGTNEEQQDSSVAVRQLLPRLVSDELQLYFTRITDTLSSTSSQYPEAAITRLASDKCIQELIPFIIQYITRNIHQNMKNVEQCRLMIQCVDALIRNPNVHLELHLHQLLGPVLTCIVAKHIGSSSLTSDNQDEVYSHENENHWILRDEASDVLARICFTYGEKYKNLQGSVLKTLCKALEHTSYDYLGSWYGGIIGITKFGVKAMDAFLLPLMGYTMVWEETLDQDKVDSLSRKNRNIRYALHRCQDALLYAMAVYMEKMEELDPSNRLDYVKYSEVFGDRLTPFCNRMDMEYSSYFI